MPILLAALSLAPAQAPTGGAKVYQDAVPAVVWIQSSRPGGLATGSGTLVDAGRRLVLTNYHVVEDNPKATVFFPEFRDGRPVPEKAYYRDRAARFGVPGRVVVVSKTADLAVVQIDRVPDGVKAVALAADSPAPGETVHSIGNAGKSGALWGYVRGTVRQVYRKSWQARLGSKRVQAFAARVIETDSPTNPGDSGGPLLNDAGKLVGVTQGGAVDAASVSYFVDVSEVQALLARREVLALRDGPRPANPAGPPTVRDGAAIFGADSVKAADALMAGLAKAGRPVRVETLGRAPAEWLDEVKAANPADRRARFNKYADGRLAADGTDGAIVVVCMDPKIVVVAVSKSAKPKYPPDAAKKAGDALLDAFKTKDYDKGLLAALAVFRDAEIPKAKD